MACHGLTPPPRRSAQLCPPPVLPIFNPNSDGSFTGTLSIDHFGSNNPLELVLSGEGLVESAILTIDPISINFGSITEGDFSDPEAITLTNNGNSALQILSVSITGANAGDFYHSFSSTFTISPRTFPEKNCTALPANSEGPHHLFPQTLQKVLPEKPRKTTYASFISPEDPSAKRNTFYTFQSVLIC